MWVALTLHMARVAEKRAEGRGVEEGSSHCTLSAFTEVLLEGQLVHATSSSGGFRLSSPLGMDAGCERRTYMALPQATSKTTNIV